MISHFRFRHSGEDKICEEHYYSVSGKGVEYLSRSVFYDKYGLITEDTSFTPEGDKTIKCQYFYLRGIFDKLIGCDKSISKFKGDFQVSVQHYGYIWVNSENISQSIQYKSCFVKLENFPVLVAGNTELEVMEQIYDDGVNCKIGYPF